MIRSRCRFMRRTAVAARLIALAGILAVVWALYLVGVK